MAFYLFSSVLFPCSFLSSLLCSVLFCSLLSVHGFFFSTTPPFFDRLEPSCFKASSRYFCDSNSFLFLLFSIPPVEILSIPPVEILSIPHRNTQHYRNEQERADLTVLEIENSHHPSLALTSYKHILRNTRTPNSVLHAPCSILHAHLHPCASHFVP